MLDACDSSEPISEAQLDYLDVDVSHYDDLESEASSTSTSRITPEDSTQNGSANPFLPEKTGLRSRKAGLYRRASTVDSHPLQSPSMSVGSNSTADGAITRPSLRRWLSNGPGLNGATSDSLDDGIEQFQGPNEGDTMVIVHEVSRTDSLAGVALRYGIALADLRKANQLWASDTIHLRQTLFIPLHLTNRKHLHFHTNNNVHEGAEVSEAAFATQRTSAIVQRIPVSQLAFFPPPAKHLRPLRYEAEDKSSTSGSPCLRSATSGAQALSSFRQSSSLPSRDALFPRLSTDSSETSSTTYLSETSSDQEHEMDVLNLSRGRERTPTIKRAFSLDGEPVTPTTTKRKDATLLPLQIYPMAVPLQTEQLKPSPMMELPRSLRRPEG